MKMIDNFFWLVMICSSVSFGHTFTERDVAHKAFMRLQSALYAVQDEFGLCSLKARDAFKIALPIIEKAVKDQSLDKKKIYTLLKEELEKNAQYHQQRITKKYDYRSFALAGGCLALGVSCGYAALLLSEKRDKPFNDAFNTYADQLKAHGITIKEERWGSNHHQINLEGSTTPQGKAFAQQLLPTLIKIREEQLNKGIDWFSLLGLGQGVTILGMGLSFVGAWQMLKDGFSPKHEQKFEECQELLGILEKEDAK